eukprot:jgi/Tetstr1/464099/TSEL_008904.t1
MDLLCDRIIRQLRDDRDQGSVQVKLKLRTSHRSGKFAIEDPDKTECDHEILFQPGYPCDGATGAVLSVSGVRFRPNRHVVKTFVTAWLGELAELSGEEDRIRGVMDVQALSGESSIYKSRVRFDYCRLSGKNKKAVNRIAEALMHIKGLCDSMV